MHRDVNQLTVAELGFVFTSSAAESKHPPPDPRMCISFSYGSFSSPLRHPQLASVLGPSRHKRHSPGEAFPEAVTHPTAALSPAMTPSRAARSQLQLCLYPHDDVRCRLPHYTGGWLSFLSLSLVSPALSSLARGGTRYLWSGVRKGSRGI